MILRLRHPPKGTQIYREYILLTEPVILRKAAHRTRAGVRTVQNAFKGCLFSQKTTCPSVRAVFIVVNGYFGHIRYFGGNLRQKKEKDPYRQCDIACGSFYPQIGCCGYIECVYGKVIRPCLPLISFPPLWFWEDAGTLSARMRGIFNGKNCRNFADTGVICVYFP